MSQVSVRPSVARNPLVERGVQPTVQHVEQQQADDDDVESSAPSSPGSVYGDEDEDEDVERQATLNQPHLRTSSPAASYPELRPSAVTELRITDSSRSQSNPAQRKKGGCKAVQLTVHVPSSGQSYVVAAKCDVRKSFSNRSFSKYYNRGPYAVIPVTPAADVVLVVEEAKRGRDGKHFVAMEQACVAPFTADDKRRHPLLAFAADAVYKLSVLTRPGTGEADVDVKCQFAQGSATVSKRSATANTESSKKRAREAPAKTEQEEDDDDEDEEEETERPADDAGKRRRLATSVPLERCSSPDSTDSSVESTPDSPFSTTDSLSSSPSYPSSPFTSSTASPSPPASPLPFSLTFQLEPPTDFLLADELEAVKAVVAPFSSAPVLPLSTAPFVASPLLVPAWPGGYARLSPAGALVGSPWVGSGAWMAVDDFVL